MLQILREELRKHSNSSDARGQKRYFKTGPGEYGEGDQFIGVRAPVIRQVARKFKDLSLIETESLLNSCIHEERLLSLILLTEKFRKGAEEERETIYNLYLASTRYINNWDLVDSSADRIVGAHLWDKCRKPLYQLARSGSLWERRISIMSTLHYIRKSEFEETIRIAEMLLGDSEDLIHKAVGWMLREVGNRDRKVEETFLKKHYQTMPRTMLRYAIEKFPEPLRQQYLKGTIK